MNKDQITALACKHGTNYTSGPFINWLFLAFGNEAWAAFCEALVAAQPPAVEARGVIEQCRVALAEELAGWDLDPPLHHVKQAHDRCVEWLMQAAIAQPVEVQPLTDEQLSRIAIEDEFVLFCDVDEFIQIARAVEQAHNIPQPKEPK